MGAEPACLPRTGGKIPARAGLVAARNRLHFMIDRTPGQDAGCDVEDFVGGLGIEIGRRHRADAALAEAPRGRGIRLGDFLLHLHESFERHLGAAKALRQQRTVKPVLDQRLCHRRRQPPRPLDLVGFARDQGRQRFGARHQVEAGMPVHAFPRTLLFFARARWWPIHGPRSRRRGRALLLHAAARPRSSDGCGGRLTDGKLNATATAAMPMANEPT
jgi:hypothetical protein